MPRWLLRIVHRIGQCFCHHDMLLVPDRAGPYLQCWKCGRRTVGWVKLKDR